MRTLINAVEVCGNTELKERGRQAVLKALDALGAVLDALESDFGLVQGVLKRRLARTIAMLPYVLQSRLDLGHIMRVRQHRQMLFLNDHQSAVSSRINNANRGS